MFVGATRRVWGMFLDLSRFGSGLGLLSEVRFARANDRVCQGGLNGFFCRSEMWGIFQMSVFYDRMIISNPFRSNDGLLDWTGRAISQDRRFLEDARERFGANSGVILYSRPSFRFRGVTRLRDPV